MKLKSLPLVVLALAMVCVLASGTPGAKRVVASQPGHPVTERSFVMADGSIETISMLLSADVPTAEAASIADSYFADHFPGRTPVDYVTTGDRWPASSMPLTLFYNQNVAGEPSLKDAMDFSIARWNSTSGSTYRLVSGGSTSATSGLCLPSGAADHQNTLSFADTGSPLTLGLTCTSYTLSHQILEEDIIFNPSVLFSNATVTPSNAFDLMSVVLHELGHFAGLDHPCQPGACTGFDSIMVPTIDQRQQRRTPRPDDVMGLNSLYPATPSTRPFKAYAAVVVGDSPR